MEPSCAMIEVLLTQYESLDPAERERVAAHLAECPACRASFELVEAFGERLREEAAGAMPADLTERIMAAVSGESAPAADNRPLAVLVLLIFAQAALLLAFGLPVFRNPAGWFSFPFVSLSGLDAIATPIVDIADAVATLFAGVAPAVTGLEQPGCLAAALVITLVLAALVLLRHTREKGYRHA